jgi:alpha-L-fucosidase
MARAAEYMDVRKAAQAAAEPREMTWDSLEERPVPPWYDDAKLGIIIHWGPYAVPAWAPLSEELPLVVAESGWERWFSHNPYAEWYGNSMLINGSPTQEHHRGRYGRLSRYDTFARDFRQGLKEWDPTSWVDPISQSGARYVVFTAKHHDGFLMWPSRRRNPRKSAWQLSRDVIGELSTLFSARGLRFGLYYSGGLDWSFSGAPIRTLEDLRAATPRSKTYAAYVEAHWRELISRYSPAILWNDIGSPPGIDVLKLLERYYEAVPDGVVNDRFGQVEAADAGSLPQRALAAALGLFVLRRMRHPKRALAAPAVRHADFRTVEYDLVPRGGDGKWETVRGLGHSFGYNAAEGDAQMLSVAALVHLLADVTARGGNLLLGVGPAADGTLPAAQQERLRGLGEWLKVNGEAIFGSHPWGDDLQDVTEEGMQLRYTARGMSGYVILMGTPQGRTILIPSLRLPAYSSVRILGHMSYITWHQDGRDIHIRLTEPLREAPAHVISITPRPRNQ